MTPLLYNCAEQSGLLTEVACGTSVAQRFHSHVSGLCLLLALVPEVFLELLMRRIYLTVLLAYPFCSFEVRLPSSEARTKFFSKLIDSVFSVCNRKGADKPKQKETLPDLPKAPKVNKGPSAAELQARAETEEHALRRLRMCLRDVCNRCGTVNPFHLHHLCTFSTTHRLGVY